MGHRPFNVIRELTQLDGLRLGMTKKCGGETVHSRSCATFFPHSAVLSLTAVLLREVPNRSLMPCT